MDPVINKYLYNPHTYIETIILVFCWGLMSIVSEEKIWTDVSPEYIVPFPTHLYHTGWQNNASSISSPWTHLYVITKLRGATFLRQDRSLSVHDVFPYKRMTHWLHWDRPKIRIEKYWGITSAAARRESRQSAHKICQISPINRTGCEDK